MVAVYPEAVWYSHVDVAGAEQILHEHLIAGQVVESYRYNAPPGDNKLPK
jgi:(2Fe-2S) ferredoxin